MNLSAKIGMAIVGLLAALGIVGAGLRIGTPWHQGALQRDALRVLVVRGTEESLRGYFRKNRTLPENLNLLPGRGDYYNHLAIKYPLEYKRVSDSEADLCMNFETEGSEHADSFLDSGDGVYDYYQSANEFEQELSVHHKGRQRLRWSAQVDAGP